MTAETISVRELTAAHIGRTWMGKEILRVDHLVAFTALGVASSLLDQTFVPGADGSWPTIELDVDPWTGVELPTMPVMWFVQRPVYGDDWSTVETLARNRFNGVPGPARLVRVSAAAGAEIVAVKP